MENCSYFLSPLISQTEYIIGSFIVLMLLGWGLFSVMGDRAGHILAGLVLGGAVLNLIERAIFGCVRDYLNFFNLFHFNLADFVISVGVLTLIYRLFIKPLLFK